MIQFYNSGDKIISLHGPIKSIRRTSLDVPNVIQHLGSPILLIMRNAQKLYYNFYIVPFRLLLFPKIFTVTANYIEFVVLTIPFIFGYLDIRWIKDSKIASVLRKTHHAK